MGRYRTGCTEEATEYLSQNPEGGTAEGFNKWAGFDNIFVAKHGLDLLRYHGKVVRRNGIYFLASQIDTWHALLAGIEGYVSSLKNGTTVDAYARMSDKPADVIAAAFDRLKKDNILVEHNGRFYKPSPVTLTESSAPVNITKSLLGCHRGSIGEERQRKVLDYLSRTPEGTKIKEYSTYSGLTYQQASDAFYVLHARGQIREHNRRFFDLNAELPKEEPIPEKNSKPNPTRSELRSRRRGEIVAYLQEHPEGVTLKEYVQIKNLSENILGEDFRILKAWKEIKTGSKRRYFHKDVEIIPVDKKVNSDPLPIEQHEVLSQAPHRGNRRLGKKEKTDMPVSSNPVIAEPVHQVPLRQENPLDRILNYLDTHKTAMLHDMLALAERDKVVEFRNAGFIRLSGAGFYCMGEKGRQRLETNVHN